MILSRWGGLGNHRYQIGFSGDTRCSWPSLAFQPYFTATAGNVGFAYWSHDIGGHEPGPVDPQLYARWIQWGVFSPTLRTHATKHPEAERRIWKFSEETFQVAREAFHLRHALIPYIYTAARQCYDTGLPLCRPLYYEWPELNEAYERPGEYLFGDQMLVAPVVKPADPDTGCAEITVWIPPGEWTNWFTGKTYTGPANVTLLVPLDEIPVFVRRGAIIPTRPKMSRTGAVAAGQPLSVDPLILHIWPGPFGQFVLYEDDGETVGYQEDEHARTPISHRVVDKAGHIAIGPVEGSFRGMPKERTFELRLREARPAEEVAVNGKLLKTTDDSDSPGWRYDTTTSSLIVRLPRRALTDRAEIVVKSSRTHTDEGPSPTGFERS